MSASESESEFASESVSAVSGFSTYPKRRATFLLVIGPAPYKLLRSLLAPAKPKEKKYDEVVAKLTEHYSPTPSEVMHVVIK